MTGRTHAPDDRVFDFVPTEPVDRAEHHVRAAYLEPLGGGERVRIGAVPLVLGRGPSCALRLNDTRVSGEHARVQATHEGVHVCDLSSTNGTFVNDQRVDQTWLTAPAILTVGQTSYRVVLDELEVDALPAPRSFGGVTGRAPAMLELFDLVERAAPTACSVLLRGEAGTGKERIARAIHAASRRREGPFIVVHAANLRTPAAAATLLGDARPALAGDETDGAGLFAQAHGGTMFIKEIGELPRAIQAKIHHVLETKSVQPVGGKPRPIDVRVIASASSDLDAACKQRTFRYDLLRRIAQVRVQVPALRERRHDVRLLASELCRELHQVAGLPAGWLDDDALSVLEAYDWPGNVRELKNVLEQALIESRGAIIERDRLEHALRVQQGAASSPATQGTVMSAKDRNRRAMHDTIRNLYRQSGGNITRTASAAGLDRHTVRKMLQELGEHPARKEPDGSKG